MKTSKRLTALGNMNTIRCIRKDGRYAIAFQKFSFCYDYETGEPDETIIVEYGYEGMPADYREEFDNLSEAAVGIRKFQDLRGWRIDGE